MKARNIAAMLIVLGALPARPQLRPTHFVLTAGQIARILAGTFAARGVEISEGNISLPASVVATVPEPVLVVRSVEMLGHIASDRSGEVSSAVKLTCREAGVCLPFYAIVTFPETSHTTLVKTAEAPRSKLQTAKATQTPPAVLAGAHATLLMEDGSSRIQLRVVTLESGAIGRTIRVSSPDHKQVYQAVVVGEGLLKGTF